MGTEKERSIHNFTMPHELRWRNRRFLRCAKINSNGRISPLRRVAASNSDQHGRSNCTLQPRTAGCRKREIESWSGFLHGSRKIGRTSSPASDINWRFSGYDDEISATRERVILDLQTATEEMKDAIFKDGLADGEVYKAPPPPAIASVESELNRPWNLRRRRADIKTSFVSSTNVDAGGEDESVGGKKPVVNAAVPMRLRRDGGKKERPKFAVALSKREIEEDFYSMVGRRPPQRPKKRNRNLQRHLDTLFPGLWLSEITPNMYKVADGEFGG